MPAGLPPPPPTHTHPRSLQACPLFGELLHKALRLLRRCGCEGAAGCPGCCQHVDCSEYNAMLNKQAGIAVLEAVLEAEGLSLEEEGGEEGEGGRAEGPRWQAPQQQQG